MPVDENILGFSNRWYKKAVLTAHSHQLSSGKIINCVTSPLFLATKLEGYNGRGNNDPLSSHDLEDILLVVDGRDGLVAEVVASDTDIRAYIYPSSSLSCRPIRISNIFFTAISRVLRLA